MTYNFYDDDDFSWKSDSFYDNDAYDWGEDAQWHEDWPWDAERSREDLEGLGNDIRGILKDKRNITNQDSSHDDNNDGMDPPPEAGGLAPLKPKGPQSPVSLGSQEHGASAQNEKNSVQAHMWKNNFFSKGR